MEEVSCVTLTRSGSRAVNSPRRMQMKNTVGRVRMATLRAIRANGHDRDITVVVTWGLGRIQAVERKMHVVLVVMIHPSVMIITYPDGGEKQYDSMSEKNIRHLLSRVDSFFFGFRRQPEPEL